MDQPGLTVGIFQRFFSADTRPGLDLDLDLGLDLDLARKVVQDYANFLNTSAPLPGCVADSQQLPHHKELIKESLFTCINATGDPELIGHLKNGYLMLSAWQEGVGEHNLGMDFTELDLEAEPMFTAAQVQRQRDEVAHWRPLVEAEQKLLSADLLAFGV
ncbi:MAG: hypothetical protein GWP63_13315 [Haliea sp.]|jgi:hypothetical protein|nr:hypothetical protein [Haliea sp.]